MPKFARYAWEVLAYNLAAVALCAEQP